MTNISYKHNFNTIINVDLIKLSLSYTVLNSGGNYGVLGGGQLPPPIGHDSDILGYDSVILGNFKLLLNTSSHRLGKFTALATPPFKISISATGLKSTHYGTYHTSIISTQ